MSTKEGAEDLFVLSGLVPPSDPQSLEREALRAKLKREIERDLRKQLVSRPLRYMDQRLRKKARGAQACRAEKLGLLAPPMFCEGCGTPDFYWLEKHHYRGYDYRNALKVKYLCHRCHMRVHHSPNKLGKEMIARWKNWKKAKAAA